MATNAMMPNRAQRRGTHMARRHMSKAYSRGRAAWNWRGGCFGQPTWRRVKPETIEN